MLLFIPVVSRIMTDTPKVKQETPELQVTVPQIVEPTDSPSSPLNAKKRKIENITVLVLCIS